ncbi:unnamed protein product [Lupinus luteus]|uniref:Uncharacterized protein n=1 Tax=Lupinus luteus TaxID=3873 RepID=A0AAV1W457_LUPLU
MAGIHGSSGDVSADSKEQPSQVPKAGFSDEEDTLITILYNLVGERWSLIAGRIPGRTAEEIEEYWNSKNSTGE